MASLTDIVRIGVNNMLTGRYEGLSSNVAHVVELGLQEQRKQFPDLHYELDAAIEKDNTVMFRFKGSGTHALSQRKISWAGTGFALIKDGVITKIRVDQDEMSRKLQLGEFPRVAFGPLSGSWVATIQDTDVRLELGDDSEGVWGEARFGRDDVSPFTGTASDGRVVFDIAKNDGEMARFSGQVVSGDVIRGTIEGQDEEIEFNRV